MSIARNLADFARSLSVGGVIANATTSIAGLMSGADKTKLDAIPDYRLRAAVNFSGVPLSGTYSRTGTLVTVTMTAHGMATGQVVNLDFTTGTATDGTYTVTVTGVNEFTVVDSASGSTSGNVTRQIFIRSSLNISSITDNGTGDYTINFTSAMTDVNFVTLITSGDQAFVLGTPLNYLRSRSTTTQRLSLYNLAGTLTDYPDVCITIFR